MLSDNKKYSIGLVFFLIYWLLFLGISGTLFSGFHLYDDHDIIKISSSFKDGTSITDIISDTAIQDLDIRFRPLYYFHKVFLSIIFDDNAFLWSLHSLILAVISSFSLFYFFYNLKIHPFDSTLLVMFTLVGIQSTIWYELGPSETIGFTFFSLSLAFLINGLRSNRKSFVTLFCIFFILSTLCKESFVLTIPGIIFLFLFLSSNIGNLPLIKSFQKNLTLIIALTLVFIIELIVIKFFVGTEGIGYAGYVGIHPLMVKNIAMSSSVIIFTWTTFLIAGVITAFYIIWWRIRDLLIYYKSLILPIIIFFLIFSLQSILYYKSGMYERYLIPTTFAFALLIGFMIKNINIEINKGKFVFFLILISSILINGVSAYEKPVQFAIDGTNFNEVLKSIEKNSNPNSSILIIADPASNYEASSSILKFLHAMNRDNVYFYEISRKNYSQFEESLVNKWKNRYIKKTILTIDDVNKFDLMLLFYINLENTFYSMSNINKINYERYRYGDYCLFVKKIIN